MMGRLKDRRTFLTAVGAGVLAVTSFFWMQKLPEQGTIISLVQNDREASADTAERYPEHKHIITTVFWVGEPESDDEENNNDNIHNRSSVWVEDWTAAYGGVDDPDNRCGYQPCGFEPKENPFYFALPFNDYNSKGLKPAKELEAIPWYDGHVEEGKSILKNRWIEITYEGKKVYSQWEDAGPFGEDDADYVFGTDRPQELRAGLDVSPAVADYVGLDGRGKTSWRFIDEADVPPGPWRETITRSDPQW